MRRTRYWPIFLSWITLFVFQAAFTVPIRSDETITIDADFPGGNIIVDRIEVDQIFLHQDLRDTKGDWFYWYFRVRGAERRSLVFYFTQSSAIGVRGPAVSLDEGKTWRWLGKEAVHEQSFRYTVPDSIPEVRFSFAIPYVEADLNAFLTPYRDHPNFKIEKLCQTNKGRIVERLHVGRLDGRSEHRVLLTCRHHACEMMANFVLEGVMETVLSESDDGQWFREQIEFLMIPFVDKDGVEEGDQGKNRIPHDHNRDYESISIYPSVQAIRSFVPPWSTGKLHIAIDLHCPYISGPNNENIYFVGSPDAENWKRVERFSEILEQVQTGPLIFRKKNNIPFGQAWNTAGNYTAGKSCGRWTSELAGIWFGTSIEIPYANANDCEVTAETARWFGRDLAKAMRIYLENQ
ncbi:MAG: peptidase M14 [Candidatus Omnitrophota bacterium]|jgi:hypothetical protein|nr:MAG: peptidase M14 [Candidatus Omnitrophota bacterium]